MAKVADPAWPRRGRVSYTERHGDGQETGGAAFGGNKVRQLEFHFGEAQARAVQSNLVRLAAAGACRLGMDAHVQLEERVDDAGALYRASGNLLLDWLLGATLHAFPVGEDEAAADAALGRRARALADEGHRPYVIHFAPGHPPLGGLGYVLAAEEVTAQSRALGVHPREFWPYGQNSCVFRCGHNSCVPELGCRSARIVWIQGCSRSDSSPFFPPRRQPTV